MLTSTPSRAITANMAHRLTAVLLLSAIVSAAAVNGPSPPTWPQAFEMAYTLRLPYLDTIQMAGLKIPVHVWYDGLNNQVRMDVYNGLDSTYMLPDFTYNIFPRIDQKACWAIENTAGPTALLRNEGGQTVLPDISAWQYGGQIKMPSGTAAYIWSLTENHYEKTNVYTFYTAQLDGRPLRLYMAGVNLFTGSHFDEYIVEFTLWNKLSPGSAAVFRPPPLCAKPSGPPSALGLSAAIHAQALALLPARLASSSPAAKPSAVSAATSLFKGLQRLDASRLLPGSKRPTDAGLPQPAVTANRQPLLEANRQLVESWNLHHADAAGYKLTLNRFASWPHEQFAATRMGHVATPKAEALRLRQRPGSAYLGSFQRRLEDWQLPKQVDYRGTGADGPVKDQASCGSCWAFGTTGTMTGTWFRATGQVLSLSEQHIVDCAWDYDVNGCWGGFGEAALDMIRDMGGAVMEDEYPYIGQNGYCRTNTTTKAAFFSGYKTVPEGDEGALMEALATHGPLYVAFDAGDMRFKFYSEGVYQRADCAMDRDHLNHAVTLVGYGTTEQGVNYWLMRNSWSKLWGDDGYFKITRKSSGGNDCGISTDAVLAVVDEAAAARARASMASQSTATAVV